MTEQENVINILEAFGGGLGTQDVEITDSYYKVMYDTLETPKEKDALMFGALAISTKFGGMKLRHAYYAFRFKRAMNKIKAVDIDGSR